MAALAVVILALVIGMAVYSHSARFSDEVKKSLANADAGFKKATNTIDPEALRTWALESIRTNATIKDVTNSIPHEIQTLYPEPPQIEIGTSGLTLSWGGGFFHWVFYIGATNDTLPHISQNRQYPFNFEWRPGIYYTREANQELQ
ncbi:MAG TPA: hypothetical protein VHC44_06320 [Verrucomicrobiae bacterium]|nr:hypothetical protein [Verrucomicrobiae bacterium]